MIIKFSLVVFFIGLISFNAMSRANDLALGNWEGQVEMHELDEQHSTFVVEQSTSGEYSITMYYDQRPYSFENLQVMDDGLSFDLDTGSKYSCKLTSDDEGSFAGECTITLDDETRMIKIGMQAPEKIVAEVESELPQI